MGGFFGLIFGILILLIKGIIENSKQSIKRKKYKLKIKEDNLNCRKIISVYGFDFNGKEIYRDNRNNRKVYKSTDQNKISRWKYSDNNKLVPNMSNVDNYNKFCSLVKSTKYLKPQPKWIIIENFWEDSIIQESNNYDFKLGYLDNFKVTPDIFLKNICYRKNRLIYEKVIPQEKQIIEKYFYDNNPLNQKIYINNLRPYQLAGIYKEKNNSYIIVYLIRFGTNNLIMNETHNILDKQNSNLWSKWYAITKEEFESLTNLNKGKLWCPSNLVYENKKEITMLKYYMKQVDISNVAFIDGIDTNNWEINNELDFYGVKRAFDENNNFIGD